jgi:hypothetical protein
MMAIEFVIVSLKLRGAQLDTIATIYAGLYSRPTSRQ